MLKDRLVNLWGRLTRKYRLVVYDHESLSQSRAVILKPLTVWILGAGGVFLVAILTGLTLAYFPAFQKAVPGLGIGSADYKQLQTKNLELEKQVAEMDSMIKVFSNAMSAGRRSNAPTNPEMYEAMPSEDLAVADPTGSMNEPILQDQPGSEAAANPSPSPSPSLPDQPAQRLSFRERAEGIVASRRTATSGQAASPVITPAPIKTDPSSWNLIPPVDGYVTMDFNTGAKDHFGIDLVANENSLIRSVADGVVVFSEYSTTTGYVIGIWHGELGLISFYKHNSRLFKPVGSYAFAGEAIAVIGNTGINSSGTHLHFELWHDNNPVNPADFIVFN